MTAIRRARDADALAGAEWLVTNGLGGYASGVVTGAPTRRYHGYLIAALPNPAGRVMMLNALAEQVKLGKTGKRYDLGWVAPGMSAGAALPLDDFWLEDGLPVWRFAGHGIELEKRVVIAAGFNTSILCYSLVGGDPVRLELRPAVQFRGHDDFVAEPPGAYTLAAEGSRIELIPPNNLPALRLHVAASASTFVIEPTRVDDLGYNTEAARGYPSRGGLYSPGRFRVDLPAQGRVALVASTESWETILTVGPDELLEAERERRARLVAAAVPRARSGVAQELVLAADAFVFKPAGRAADRVRARIAGDEAWSVIAGYHWFTDWGRDTMISLEGLTLVTGRVAEASAILRTFAYHVRDGLVPNMFPEGASQGLYHTADATLWFFHAIDRYLRATGDTRTLVALLPILRDILDHHLRGTRFNIGVDPADGLLREGWPDLPLTWMDAKCDGWIPTPRRGKPVEINALWYNALVLGAGWLAQTGDAAGAKELEGHALRARESFGKFWNPQTGYLFDVIDGEHGNDPVLRPNQLLAISLPNPVLDPAKWQSVFAACEQALLTPVGLRSLAPGSPEYKPRYDGDLRARDAAYHQGTVWSWLIGPFIDARLRVYPQDLAGARAALAGLVAHLGEACIGQISEVFDAEGAYAARGCIAQAWGVAELLRALVVTGDA
ncbi:MAG TPA: amylo-alpha-1,6-glucosidase [Kofleriaceae bacterium]